MRRLISVFLLTVVLPTCLLLKSAEGTAPTSNFKTVIVIGTGESREAAIQNALHAAVEQALGGRIAALSEVRNGRLAAHHVHFHSNGFVNRYDVIDDISSNGTVSVRLRAEVREGDGTSLSGANIDGRRVLALAESQYHQRVTAGQLWTDLIEQWCGRVAVARPVSTVASRRSAVTHKIELRQTVMLTVDQTRYTNAASELQTVLQSLATAQGRFVAWMATESVPDNLSLWKSGLPHQIDSLADMEWLSCGNVRTCRGIRFTSRGDDLLTAASTTSDSILIFVQNRTGSSRSTPAWRWYQVPASTAFRQPAAELEVTLVDSQRHRVERRVWPLGAKLPGYSWQARTFGRDIPSIVLAPSWVAHSGKMSTEESLITTRTASLIVPVSLHAEALARVRRIEAEIVTAPRWESVSR